MAYKIQHLGLGGILDQAIAIIKDHFGLLFKIMLFLMVPFNLIFGYAFMSLFPAPTGIIPTPEQQAQTNAAMAQYWPFFILVMALQLLLVLPVTNAAVIQAVAHLYLGKRITAVQALKDGFRLMGPLIFTAILYYLAVFAGFFLLIIGAIIFGLWFSLCLHVVVIEGISGPAALGRSRKLVRGQLGTLILLGLIMWLISLMFGLVPNFIPQRHLQILGSTFSQAFSTMLWTAIGVVFYFSCRCANENFDLQLLAENIAEPALADDSVLGQRTI